VSRVALWYVFAMVVVVLALVLLAFAQNWWDARRERK
jgi:surface polysaccharide O-acyltransferase-like enzyme